MNDQAQRVITEEWRIAADEAAKVLSVARAIERRQYPEGDAPAGLVPALVLAVAINRAARMMPEGSAS
jgi:hypothetical protein